MCNLYRMTKGKDEVAGWFDAVDETHGANFAEEVYPGYPGLVVAQGRVRPMHWGFPLVMKGKQGQPLKPRPVNNTRTDKLESYFWRSSFEARRCLIPLSAWAEAEGAAGAKTRSWISLGDTDLFAVAGLWRSCDEWGDVYSMVMTDAAGAAANVHTRMPVILAPEDYSVWTAGDPVEAKALCQPRSEGIDIDRTSQPWVRGAAAQSTLL